MKLFTLKSFSFKSFAAIGLVFFISLASVWEFYHTTTSKENEQAYRRLVESAHPINSNIKSSPYTAHQQREGGQKNIFFMQEANRLQIQLTSQDSLLVLDNRENGLEIVEKMQKVKCWMQEELYYLLPDGRELTKQSKGQFLIRNSDPNLKTSWIDPQNTENKPMQRLRYFEADFATYFYNGDKFVAEQVKIYTYTAPSHTLPGSFEDLEPTMTGRADSVEFSLSDKTIKFTAQHLKATFFEQGKLF